MKRIRQSEPNLRFNHDGVKDRQNDIIYFDRNSNHDENITHMLTDYMDLANQMKNLLLDSISIPVVQGQKVWLWY